jgi:membrane protease YdiL (CAAX protease family)
MKLIVRIVVFYALTFLFTLILGGLQQAAGLAALPVGLPQWGPGVAALAMLLLFRRDGLRLSLGMGSAELRRMVPALLLPVGVAAVLFAILRPVVVAPETALWLLLPGMALGAFGEELGWRGYLHKRIDPALRPLVSSALVGVLWALWHFGLYGNGAVYMIAFVLTAVAWSVVLYRLVAARGFNVWIATAFHLSLNLTNLLFFGIINEPRFMIANAVAWLTVATVLVVNGRDPFRRAPVQDQNGRLTEPEPGLPAGR